MIKFFILSLSMIPTLMPIASIYAAAEKEGKPFEIEKYFAEIKSKKGAQIFEEDEVWQVNMESESSVYIFTKEGHFAHPSVLIGTRIEKNGEPSIRTGGYTAADRDIFERWRNTFHDMNDPAKKSSGRCF